MKRSFALVALNGLMVMLVLGIGGLTAMVVQPDLGPAILPNVENSQTQVSPKSHLVKLTSEGNLPGKILVADTDGMHRVGDVNVHFVRDGQPIAVVQPGQDGIFNAKGLTPGEYAVIAEGPRVVAAYTVNVVDNQVEAAEELQLATAGIPATDFPVLKSLMENYVADDFCARVCGSVVNETTPVSNEASSLEAKLIPVPEFTHTSYQEIVEPAPELADVSSAANTIQAYPVQLHAGGMLGGQINWTDGPAENAVVTFIRDGEVQTVAQTSHDGTFQVAGLEEGSYSVVATCGETVVDSGCACFSVDCAAPTVSAPVIEAPCQVDACLVETENMEYTVDTICPNLCGEEVIIAETPIVEEGCCGAPADPCCGGGMGFGGYAGGFGGGYGGGGGGLLSGGGGLLPLGLLGLGAYAISEAADDDDGGRRIIVASPASP